MTIARHGIEGDPFALGQAQGAAMAPAIREIVLQLDSVERWLSQWFGSDRIAQLEAASVGSAIVRPSSTYICSPVPG